MEQHLGIESLETSKQLKNNFKFMYWRTWLENMTNQSSTTKALNIGEALISQKMLAMFYVLH